MQDLEGLRNGLYQGSKTLKLSCGLKVLPAEVLDLAPSLEMLDLSGNSLHELPDDFELMQNLKILFCSDNLFRTYPRVLSKLPALEMVAFKSNGMKLVPESAIGVGLRWLILSNNKIKSLPGTIGLCRRMEKLMLAGNDLSELPIELSELENLALLRISANNISAIPNWLMRLPKLAFLAFAGNPCSSSYEADPVLEEVDWSCLQIQSMLGSGASGEIFSALLQPHDRPVAVKIFKGHVTSDGFPQDEMNACILAGAHPNLIDTIGRVRGLPDNRNGLLLQLIPRSYTILGLPPSFATCSRDCFPPDLELSVSVVYSILTSIASAAAHLHQRGISHGDLYAHNILVNDQGVALLGDFGAATFYSTQHPMKSQIERLDILAFGHLVEDLLGRIQDRERNAFLVDHLKNLWEACAVSVVDDRPTFQDVLRGLQEH